MATSGKPRLRDRLWNYPRRGKGPIHRWVPSWRFVVGAFLGFVALGTGAFASAWLTTSVPQNLGDITHQTTTVFFADGETEIGRLGARRQMVRLDDLPSYVGDAVVASEDATFWTNSGIHVRGILRSAWNNLRGNPTQGGSTITMQYIERTRTDATSGMVDKAREAIMALQVTRTTPKEDILEAYLNTIYWGRGVFGVEAAAQAYFGTPAADLTLSQAALLAGILPSPNNWEPGVNEDQARFRWQRNINRMYSEGLISAQQRAEAEFPEFLPRPTATNTLGGQAGFLVNEVIRELSDTDEFRDRPELLRTRGLHIVTTIDPALQDAAVDVATSAFEGENPADDALAVSLAAMDPETGEIRALFGGMDYLERQFNTATQGSAQAGSTFKPFTLVAALEDGFSLEDRFNGQSQKTIPGWDPANGNRGPRNFGGANFGNITLVDAMADSVNTVFAQLNVEVGPQRTVDVAHRLGIPRSVSIPAVPANVLGPTDVSVLDLATAYSTIANGGDRVTPHIVREVRTLDGALIHEGPRHERVDEFDRDVMAATTHALAATVENGSGRTARELRGPNGERRPAAGKTGTSNDNVSSWFAGYVPQLVTVVGIQQERDGRLETIAPFGQWAGSASGMTGSTFPARAWTDFMHVATEGMAVQEFPRYTPTRPTPEAPVEEPADEELDEQDDEQGDPQEHWVTVPGGLVGQSRGQVQATLGALGLQVRVEEVESTRVQGTVLSVSPSGGRVPPGSTITIEVSAGPAAAPDPTPPPPSPTPPSPPGAGDDGTAGSDDGADPGQDAGHGAGNDTGHDTGHDAG